MLKPTVCIDIKFNAQVDIDCELPIPRYLSDILLLKSIQYSDFQDFIDTKIFIRKQHEFYVDFLVSNFPDYIQYQYPTNKIDCWILPNMKKHPIEDHDLPMAPMGYQDNQGNTYYY